MRVMYLDYILKCIIDEFLSFAEEKDIEDYKKKYPGLKWELGFEDAVLERSDNGIQKRISIENLIDFILERKLKT